MSGHGSSDQLAEIESREASIDLVGSPVEELIELALLYIEPAHREQEAVSLLEAAIAREGSNGEARVWLAYVLLHAIMDAAALARASEVVAPLGTNPQFAGAANLLLAEIGEQQEQPLGERIALLELSVQAEPRWVNNRHDLAWAYSEAGQQDRAAEQLREALSAIEEPSPTAPLLRREFEESISGRTSFGAKERLESDLAALRS